MFKLDGKIIRPGSAFVHNGIHYPSNWVQLSTAAERAAIGLVDVVEQPRPDDRFYFVSSDGNGGWASTPRPLAAIQATLTDRIKERVMATLASSDWMVIRAAEGYKAIPAPWVTFRNAVRDNGNALVTEINGFTTLAQVAAWRTHGWPDAPQ